MSVILPILLAAWLPARPATFSPAAGTYTSTQNIVASTLTPGAAIYWCQGASACTPTRSSTSRYLAAIPVSSSATICAQAYAANRQRSKVSCAAYVINTQPSTGWAATCAAEPMRSTGTTYYACDCLTGAAPGCTIGNDNNTGTDPRSPVRTMGKVSELFRAMSPGGTVALCRGGVFDAAQGSDYGNTNGCTLTAAGSCILRDYDPHNAGPSHFVVWGTGAEPKPSVTAFSNAAYYGIHLGGGPGPSSLTQGARFLNVRFASVMSQATVSDSSGAAWDPTWNNVEICGCEFDNWGLGLVTNGQACATLSSGWKIRGNRITNNCLDGLLVDMSNTDVDGNYFDNNGHDACNGYSHLINPSGGTAHTFYWSSWCGGTNIKFINNEVHRNAYATTLPGHTVNVAGSVSGSAVVTDSGQNFTVENNLIDMYPAATIDGNKTSAGAFFGGQNYGVGAGLVGLTVRRNRVYGMRGRQIGYSSAPNAIIEDNVVTMTGDADQTDAVIVLPHNQGTSKVTSGGTVRNNTIYMNLSAGYAGGISVAGTSGGAGFNVTGNTVTYLGMSSGPCYSVGTTGWLSFMDYNHCYNGNAWANGSSLASWQGSTGRDAHSITTAPNFVDATNKDFTPALGSPLIGAGSAATTCTVKGVANQPCSSTVAIESPTWSATGTAKTRDASPDIGAYER